MTDFQEKLAKEQALNADIWHIVHVMSSPPAKDDSEAEWERVLQLDNAWAELREKYGKNLIEDLTDLITEAVSNTCDHITEGEQA